MNLINNSVGRAIKFVALFSLLTLYIEHIRGRGGGEGEGLLRRDTLITSKRCSILEWDIMIYVGRYKEHTAGNQQVREISSFVCGNTIIQALRTVSVLWKI